jgi:hypothetical protein
MNIDARLTDEEVRGSLRRLQRGDSVSIGLRTLMCLQFAAVFLILGPLTDLYAWMAYVLLALIPVTWFVGAVLRRRDGRGAPEAVRRLYETILSGAIEKARKRRDHIWWQGSVAVLVGGTALVLPAGRTRDTGAVLSIMFFLAALDAYQQWKMVLPRLQREQGEYRDMLIGLDAPCRP